MKSSIKSFTQELKLVNLQLKLDLLRVAADLIDFWNVSDYLMDEIIGLPVSGLLQSLRDGEEVMEEELYQVYEKWMFILGQRILNTATNLK